ncbi:hypothetical protein CPB84DRAFT_1693684 [Gymnopilus junonius]|uniref:Uncharacterized protein n=1 Tax=Gymnopilus junonius TaxID=109634 RepID=A0A9P5N6Z5_GYMJU|nr:hypothetical protein CPB84DRAFT_1693684 [Gymnopilus junonius]
MFIPRRSVGVLITWLFFLFLPLVQGGAVNRTIDDASSDVIYSPITPQGPWANQNCEVCAIKPDLSQVFDNTYTAATWYPTNGTMSITMQFTGNLATGISSGTAIYVFFVLVNNVGAGLSTETLVDFTLDGDSLQRFEHTADSQNPLIQYNQLVFHQLNLQNTQHTLVISASQVPTSIYVNFDYAMYT